MQTVLIFTVTEISGEESEFPQTQPWESKLLRVTSSCRWSSNCLGWNKKAKFISTDEFSSLETWKYSVFHAKKHKKKKIRKIKKMLFYSSVTRQVSSLNPLNESWESESAFKTNDTYQCKCRIIQLLITSSAPVRQNHPQLCSHCLGPLVFYTVVKLAASVFVWNRNLQTLCPLEANCRRPPS